MLGKRLELVFQVCLNTFPVGRDSVEVKKIIKVKFLWIIAARAGRFYEWESVFLKKHPRYVFRGTLSLVVVPKCFHDGFLRLYLSKWWQSASWDNLGSLNLSLKLFFWQRPFMQSSETSSLSLIFKQRLLRFTTGFTDMNKFSYWCY